MPNSSRQTSATAYATSPASSVFLPEHPGINAEKDKDDIWTVKFPARIIYKSDREIDQCLDVTMRVKEAGNQLGILNIISVGGDGCASAGL
ncbi:hypothetical protein O9X98_07705 [Agrobacterium salinitolerans]|nr:hypothetical protein [Agrobacterium salinitolerans]